MVLTHRPLSITLSRSVKDMSNITVKAARYKGGVRLDSPYVHNPSNPCLNPDIHLRAYRAKITVLPEGQFEMSVTRPDPASVEAMGRAIPPWDMLPASRTEEEQEQRDIENRQRACRRARQKIRWLVKCLGADHLVTPTYRETMQDIVKLKRDYMEFVRLVRIKYPDWTNVAVFEKQRSEEVDWSYHLHFAVRGKQDIKWLLRCWLRAIGQPLEEVEDWFLRGVALGPKSMGAVNVKGPDKKYGTKSQQWKADRLASYLTKYIAKEFEIVGKYAKKYWHSEKIEKPEIIKLWLGATNYPAAIREAHDMLYFRGVTHFDRLYGNMDLGIVWFSASTEQKYRGAVVQGVNDLETVA